MSAPNPQITAADPALSAFVAANAGSGKTRTLVDRVARLLLRGCAPGAVLCVTYTKAAAAEMQRRLYGQLGDWSVMADTDLTEKLAVLGETNADLSSARQLFARALETPGGLKIQTLHGFCEQLLRRFPLEAGLSPGFAVLDDLAAADVSARARDAVALHAAARPDDPIGQAYRHFVIDLDLGALEKLLKAFEADRAAIEAYVAANGGLGGAADDIWKVCGFDDAPFDPEALEAAATAACDWTAWRANAAHLLRSRATTSNALGQKMAAMAEVEGGEFANVWGLFSTKAGEPAKRLGTVDLDPAVLGWLAKEQARLHDACRLAKAARAAHASVMALTLAHAYAGAYETEKMARGALDFPDLILRAQRLLNDRAAAAWVLYKLDAGIEHVLLDEAQDTSPEQWAILEALTAEFFAGAGVRGTQALRTVFAVGDPKQSIFSFQGAEPNEFHRQTQAFDTRATGGGHDLRAISLEQSWRSTPEVLSFVDAFLKAPGVLDAVPPPVGLDIVRHLPLRPAGGAVDLWPIVQDAPAERPDAWDAPLDAPSADSARKRLARRIAAEIGRLTREDAVIDKDTRRPRPANPGDVLILVRRRDALFEEIIRALKKAGVPVAGADRLKLSDHVAFQDILSLCRFCLFPTDDLSLAELLRSPFCDVDEDGLYALTQPRAATLWRALREQRHARPEWRAAFEFLAWAEVEAKALPPADFFGRVMSRLDGEGRSMRQRLLTRLGREAEEAIDETLAQAMAAEARGVFDLERFTADIERADIEVKRELEGERGEVRVMTVHGAKGLEAPIVFLPDTTGQAPAARDGLLKTPEGGFLFSARQADDCDASTAARAAIKAAGEAERLRLLYVALTRARDRIVVAGRLPATAKAPPAGSWYEHVATAFARPEIAAGTRTVGEGEDSFQRFGANPPPAPLAGIVSATVPIEPPWLRRFPEPEPAAVRYAAPSTYAAARGGASPSPLDAVRGLGRYRRGDLVHRLLQLLPDLDPATRAEDARRLLAKERDLTDDQRAEIAAAAIGVLDDPRFTEVFGPGSRAEAAVAGGARDLPDDLKISGRVDRMVVTPERVLVVDFKSNRPAPDRIEAADPAYIVQMAIYAAVLREVFQGRRVGAALVWTDGPKLMPVPENMMAEALARLGETD